MWIRKRKALAAGRADRLVPPRLARDVVPRPRLDALLEEGTGGRLTLVSAPPGFGKTVLLLSWLASREDAGPVAWVSLTEEDDDPRVFWGDLAAAVGTAIGLPEPRLRLPDESFVADLLATSRRQGAPLCVVLDDFHHVRSAAVLSGLAHMLERGDANTRLVVSSRRDPDLGIQRLRLDGDVTEIGVRELAFTPEEGLALLQASRVTLAQDHVAALVARTEGWAAGLRFAALSLREREDAESFVAALAITERAVSDYLLSEVLAQQPEDVRDFLLRTSICRRITAPLADELTGRSDGARILRALEHDNVFIEPLPDGVSYRYHQLFADLLRAEARHSLGAELASVRVRAARWYAANGFALDALGHAVAAEDAELVGELVGSVLLELVAHGEIGVAAGLLERLPPDAVASNPDLALFAAWYQLCAGQWAESDAFRSRADELAEPLDGVARLRYRRARSALDLARARLEGDPEELYRAVAELTRPEVVLRPSHDRLRSVLVGCAMGAAAAWRGDLDAAETLLDEAIDAAQREGLDACECDARSLLAFVSAVRGDLKRAARLGRSAVLLDAHEPGRGRSPRTVPALAALALCALQWNDVEAGEAYVREARELAAASGDHVGRLMALSCAAWGLARIGPNPVDELRLELTAVLRQTSAPVPPLLAPALAVLASKLALAEGDSARAREALATAGSLGDGEVLSGRARVLLADGDPKGALETLRALGETEVVFGRTRVEAAVLHAIAAQQSGEKEEARTAIDRALELAEPEAIRGPFLEAGPAVVEPLRASIRNGTAHRWLAGELLACSDGRAPGTTAPPRELLEPLSEKEETVLRYLPTLMSNQEIAGELFVSVNTVKTHLKNIYRKLGASNRRDAVRRAQELRLVG